MYIIEHKKIFGRKQLLNINSNPIQKEKLNYL